MVTTLIRMARSFPDIPTSRLVQPDASSLVSESAIRDWY